MYKSKIALFAFIAAGTALGAASAHAGASTGTWKYSPQQVDRYQSHQRGYYQPRWHGYEQSRGYGYDQPRRYERHDGDNHYGWNRERENKWVPYYR